MLLQVEARLLSQTPTSLRRVLAPKLSATKNLANVKCLEALVTDVLFSSVSSLAGFSGHANYCAANAALDTFAEYAVLKGLPTLAVQWGAWHSVGESAQVVQSDIDHIVIVTM